MAIRLITRNVGWDFYSSLTPASAQSSHFSGGGWATLKVYVLTVVGPVENSGRLALRGVFIGDDEECFKAAAALSIEVNFTLVPRPLDKVRTNHVTLSCTVVYFSVLPLRHRMLRRVLGGRC